MLLGLQQTKCKGQDLELYPGNGGGTEARLRSRRLTPNPSPHLLKELNELLGAGRIRMTRVRVGGWSERAVT